MMYICLIELSQLTGIAAILRFPMPELEDEEDDDDESDVEENGLEEMDSFKDLTV